MRRAACLSLVALSLVNLHAMGHPAWGMTAPRALLLKPGQKNPMPFRVIPATTPRSLIQASDLSCTGQFLTPAGFGNPGGGAGNFPVAMRYNAGTRQYFIMDGSTAHINSFREPTLSTCGTAYASTNQATVEQDWGEYKFGAGNSAGGDAVPYFNNTGVQGMRFDGSGKLYASWSGNYSAVGIHNTFAAMTLDNVGHTLTTAGCWGITGLTQPYTGNGIITIPAAFVAAHLSAGNNFGVLGGWPFATVGAGISEGPTLYALSPPSSNACTASTDTLVNATTTLLQFSANPGGGPACTNDVVNYGLGCTPPITTISTPYPEQIAYTTYSRNTYSSDWEPYPVGAPTHGWVGFLTFGASDWYDDGTKQGYVTFLVTPEGWISETVSSSTSATAFVASGTGTHDGLNMNVGDVIWVQTCTVGVDPGCNGDQSHFGTEYRIASINTSTHAITGTIISQDNSTGNHFPVPGGPVEFGCKYAFGTPTCSRWEVRMQVIDPADLATVASGGLQPYQVVPASDDEVDQTLITPSGSPTAGNGAHFNDQQAPGISTVIADTTNKNIIVAVQSPNLPPNLNGNAIFILHVTETMPNPVEVLGSLGLLGLVSLMGRRRE